MSTHTISFYGEIWQIASKLLSNTLLICLISLCSACLSGLLMETQRKVCIFSKLILN